MYKYIICPSRNFAFFFFFSPSVFFSDSSVVWVAGVQWSNIKRGKVWVMKYIWPTVGCPQPGLFGQGHTNSHWNELGNGFCSCPARSCSWRSVEASMSSQLPTGPACCPVLVLLPVQDPPQNNCSDHALSFSSLDIWGIFKRSIKTSSIQTFSRAGYG